jgi:hypothetical protein
MRSVARQLGLSCLVVVAGVFSAGGARANRDFPMLLQQNVPMPCLPPCTLCHQTLAGGPGNIRPMSMGTTWPMYGLDGSQASSLVPTLNNVRAAMPPQDTDHDTVSDVDELAMGRDPDVADPNAFVCGAATGPEYGCVRVARQGPIDNVGALAGAFVALIGLSAVRRRTASKKR